MSRFGDPTHKRTRSPEGQRLQRWYKSAKWQRLRQAQLDAHPLCQCPHCRECAARITEATVVDHITPHRGDRQMFFDPTNLQSMAKECHDRWKQSQERGGHGFMRGADESGQPLNPAHHWFQER